MLVGGEGTRLRPLTLTRPKQMLPVVEVPMLERVLAGLAANGVDEAVLSLGYRPDAFVDAYPDGSAAGVRLVYAVEPEPLDTAGAIRFAAERAGTEATTIVVNGDVLTDLDVGELVAFHRKSGAGATIALTPVEDPSRYGVVPTDRAGRVLAFVEKPPPGHAPTNQINAGMYVIEPSVLARIPAGRRVSVERETFPEMVADGSLFALSSGAYWLDTGTVSAYLQANRDLLSGLRGSLPAPGARVMSDGVWQIGRAETGGARLVVSLLGDGASLAAGSVVTRSVVGARCIVDAGCTIEDSVLLPGARIGRGATIVESVVGEGALVGARARICDLSVVGDRQEIEAGRRLAGERVPPGPVR